ncbi:MAG: hypothetical protein ACE5F1_05675 [Planctomycetota bacterium]
MMLRQMMSPCSITLFLAFLSQPALTGVVQAQDSIGLRNAVRKALEIDGSLNPRLEVNGVPLDPLEIDRQMVYLVGQRLIREKLISLLIDDQIEQAIESGKKKRSDFEVLEDEVKKTIETNIESFNKQNPGKVFWEELAKTNTTKEEYETLTRNTILFDRIFFPGIPKQWPDITKESIIAAGGPQGEQFFQRFEESIKEGQVVPPLWLTICRKWVLSKMTDWSDIRYGSDGLRPEVCLSVNGREWMTVDAARLLADKIKPEDRERALVEIVLRTSLKTSLEANGAWMSNSRYKKEFEEYREPYDKTPFTVKVMAMTFKGYPTFEAFKTRWRLERSFEHMIEREINDDNLQAHLERAKAFLSDGRVSVNLIRIPAFDDSKGTWKSNGFQAAKSLATEVMRKLENKDLSFDEAMKKHSVWPEVFKDQGVLVNKSLNELRQELRETEYTDFISGFSVGETLFYDVEKGNIAGPLRGQDAYYIGHVVERIPPVGSSDLKDKNQRDLVKQDYLSHRFIQWSNEIASKTVVRHAGK